MNGSPRTEQLEWEAKWARPVALTAFLVVLVLFASQFAIPLLLRGGDPIVGTADLLIKIADQPVNFLIEAALLALPLVLLLPVLLFLYKAAKFRVPELLPAARVLAILGAVVLAITGIVGMVGQIAAAREFAGTPEAQAYTALPSEERLPPRLGQPVPVTPEGTAADELATSSLTEQPSLEVATTVRLAGVLAFAFGTILISVFAMRAGLLSRFMGYIGIALGAFLGLGALLPPEVLRFFDPKIIQMFWAGAIGLILLDRWPNGRGTAWKTGMAEPWPTAAEQRAAFDKRKAAELAAKTSPPPSRNGGDAAAAGKRKRKKRG